MARGPRISQRQRALLLLVLLGGSVRPETTSISQATERLLLAVLPPVVLARVSSTPDHEGALAALARLPRQPLGHLSDDLRLLVLLGLLRRDLRAGRSGLDHRHHERRD